MQEHPMNVHIVSTPGTREATREQAEAALAAVHVKYARYLKGSTTGPKLIENWHWLTEPTRWAIVWEEGPEEWALHVDTEADAARVNRIHADNLAGVWVEPVTYWAIGVYPR